MSGEMNQYAVELNGVCKHYGKKTVLNGLDLKIPRGSVCALLGNNGAGKSTTIRTLVGQLLPDAGEVRVLGLDPVRDAIALKRRIGYVAEAEKLYDFLTLPELFRFLKSFFHDWDDDRATALTRQFELPIDRALGKFSRGMYAKAVLCTVLARRPELLILDDPTLGLDTGSRRELMDQLIATVAEYEVTVLISSHLIPELDGICDWAGILAGGRLLCSEPVEQLRGRFRQLRFCAPPAELPNEVVRCTVAGETRIVLEQAPTEIPSGATVERMSLEEIFLALTTTK